MLYRPKISRFHLLLCLLCCGVVVITAIAQAKPITNQTASPTRQINMPYLEGREYLPAVIWFGQVDGMNNHVNGRIAYYQDSLHFTFHIFDQWLWYDTTPTASEFKNWDTVTLYLQADGNRGVSPTTNAYQFSSQLKDYHEPTENFQTVNNWNGAAWVSNSASISTTTGWKGVALNNNDQGDRGWIATIDIPFSSLGLSTPPEAGTTWAFAVAVHDRDNNSGTNSSIQTWPESISSQQPTTWGTLHFGETTYSTSDAIPGGTTTIRQGLNGINVEDSHVGGSTICGAAFDPDFFNGWGDANYANDTQINIQNQWDVSDWPCFSKYYVKFPLTTLPANKSILSATLTMHQFGNASPSEANPSYIQAFTIHDDWRESTITWNNAPLAVENISGATVGVLTSFPDWPGIPIQWDVTKAVQEAYAGGQPVNLALYSADGDYHSGKYFSSSDVGDWNAQARPTLNITWGNPAFELEVTPKSAYIPANGVAQFNLLINHNSGFEETVFISATSPLNDLDITFSTDQISAPGGEVTLEITDNRSNPPLSGEIYAIPITTTSNSVTKSETIHLFINGSQIYLPIIESK